MAHEEKAPAEPVRDAAVRGIGSEVAREVVQRLLYYRPSPPVSALPLQPLDLIYRDAGVATLRSSWTDPQATFVGLKAGSAAGNRHAHLDAGTVVIDALGERWLTEIGRGPYIQSYFNQDRFLYFQARTEGHNTLLVAPEKNRGGNQKISGEATIASLPSSENEAACRIDLTEVYPEATRVARTVRLFEARRRVSIVDEVELPEPAEVRWHSYTSAPIVVLGPDGRTVTLKFRGNRDPDSGKRAVLTIVSSDVSQRFVAEPAAPLPGSEAINPEALEGFSRLAIVSGAARSHRVMVEFTPWGGKP
ncbi:MAG: heparinase II/III family protein [Verrucomicrobia bacterium]|nr:heparinase II/III family protein [Verrucomicrobiota bacterium]